MKERKKDVDIYVLESLVFQFVIFIWISLENKCFTKSMVWKAWIPIYNLCDGVGIGCTTKFQQNAKNVQIKYILCD
jgi:hypothetical protein